MLFISVVLGILVHLQEDVHWRAGRYLAWDAMHAEIVVARTGDIHRQLDVAVLKRSLALRAYRSIADVREALTLDNQEATQLRKSCEDRDTAVLLKIEALFAEWNNTELDSKHFEREVAVVNKLLHRSCFDSSDAQELLLKLGTEASLEALDSQVRTALQRKLDRLTSRERIEIPNNNSRFFDELQGINSVITRYSEVHETTPEHAATLDRLLKLRQEILHIGGASKEKNLRILK